MDIVRATAFLIVAIVACGATQAAAGYSSFSGLSQFAFGPITFSSFRSYSFSSFGTYPIYRFGSYSSVSLVVASANSASVLGLEFAATLAFLGALGALL